MDTESLAATRSVLIAAMEQGERAGYIDVAGRVGEPLAGEWVGRRCAALAKCLGPLAVGEPRAPETGRWEAGAEPGTAEKLTAAARDDGQALVDLATAPGAEEETGCLVVGLVVVALVVAAQSRAFAAGPGVVADTGGFGKSRQPGQPDREMRC